MIRAVVTGGGSAGHVVPTLPIIEALHARNWNITYIGSDSGLEERLVAPLGVRYFGVRPGKLRRYWSFDNLVDAFRVPLCVLQAFGILGRHPAECGLLERRIRRVSRGRSRMAAADSRGGA